MKIGFERVQSDDLYPYGRGVVLKSNDPCSLLSLHGAVLGDIKLHECCHFDLLFSIELC
jgi:hypothetical protein